MRSSRPLKPSWPISVQKHTNVGRVTVRRLNRAEFNNTVRDLIGVDSTPPPISPSTTSATASTTSATCCPAAHPAGKVPGGRGPSPSRAVPSRGRRASGAQGNRCVDALERRAAGRHHRRGAVLSIAGTGLLDSSYAEADGEYNVRVYLATRPTARPAKVTLRVGRGRADRPRDLEGPPIRRPCEVKPRVTTGTERVSVEARQRLPESDRRHLGQSPSARVRNDPPAAASSRAALDSPEKPILRSWPTPGSPRRRCRPREKVIAAVAPAASTAVRSGPQRSMTC